MHVTLYMLDILYFHKRIYIFFLYRSSKGIFGISNYIVGIINIVELDVVENCQSVLALSMGTNIVKQSIKPLTESEVT